MNIQSKIKFWGWQFIIFIAFAIFAICIILFTEHGYTPDSYIRIGNIIFQLDYRFYSWGILPALFVTAINLVYHFFAKRINYNYISKYQSVHSVLIEGLKYVVILCIIFVLIIAWIGTGFITHPINLLITTMIVTLTIYSLLKKEHWTFWVCTILIFTATGLYFIFNNELPGETTWRISDRPINVPGEWLYNYRFFWWGVIINQTFQYAGIISFCFLFTIKLAKSILNKRQ